MQLQISKGWIRFFVATIFLVFIGFFVRLVDLQVKRHDDFLSLSDKQQYNLYSKDQNRGSIIFTYKDGKEFFAATNKTTYNIEINPKIIKNPEDTYNILSQIIDIDSNDFLQKANKKDDASEVIAKKVEIDVAKQIINLELQGVILVKERWRFYPGKNLASQVIGFQSYKGDEFKGRYGLERQYNDLLSEDSSGLFKNFFVEIFSDIKKTIGSQNSDGSLISTIEPNVQTYSEEIIKKVEETWDSQKTGIIVMNPKTGAILSMALTPNFDANNFSESEDISIFNNDSIESVYEMGSIIKPLTVAIGLDTKTITPQTTYEDLGFLKMDGRTIYNYDKKGRGVVDMQEVLNKSLNTGVAFITKKVGKEKSSMYMKKLIGQKTGIDLPNEVSSIVTNLDSTRDIEHATASYGQGIAISPIQTIRALATLSNGGYLVKPHVVKAIKYNFGLEKNIESDVKTQVFSNETSEEITRMLVKVVDEALMNGTVSIPNYSIAAKTGTAQIADKTSGGYYSDRYLHSFFGYFPAYDPQFIILLYTIEPKGVDYASQTLTNPFMDLVKYLINYYQIEPDR